MLIDYVKEGKSDGMTMQGIWLILLYCGNELLEKFGNSHKDIGKHLYGVKAKNLLRALIFEKCTLISHSTNKSFEEGQILGLLSTDANKADDLFHMVAGLCHLPLNMIGTLIVLFYYFGWAFLSAVFFAVVAFKLNAVFGQTMKKLKRERERLSDAKKNLLSELLNNIKMLKLYGWENFFNKRV